MLPLLPRRTRRARSIRRGPTPTTYVDKPCSTWDAKKKQKRNSTPRPRLVAITASSRKEARFPHPNCYRIPGDTLTATARFPSTTTAISPLEQGEKIIKRLLKIAPIVVGLLIVIVIAIPFLIDATPSRPTPKSELTTALGRQT